MNKQVLKHSFALSLYLKKACAIASSKVFIPSQFCLGPHSFRSSCKATEHFLRTKDVSVLIHETSYLNWWCLRYAVTLEVELWLVKPHPTVMRLKTESHQGHKIQGIKTLKLWAVVPYPAKGSWVGCRKKSYHVWSSLISTTTTTMCALGKVWRIISRCWISSLIFELLSSLLWCIDKPTVMLW